MKVEWVAYLDRINASEIVRLRVDEIERMYRRCGAEQFDSIFLSEHLKEDGTREFESLWFVGPTSVFEAKQFLSQLDVDSAPYDKRVFYWNVKAESFDFENATSGSRLNVKAAVPGVTLVLKASGINCDYLLSIVREILAPNMVSPVAVPKVD